MENLFKSGDILTFVKTGKKKNLIFRFKAIAADCEPGSEISVLIIRVDVNRSRLDLRVGKIVFISPDLKTSRLDNKIVKNLRLRSIESDLHKK